MVETAGTKLRRARHLRQLTLEDVARATKIRARQVADLERDEYSNFANLAYARGFLVVYAKFLHVDVRMYLEAFADASTFGLDDYQYLSEVPVGVYRAPARRVRRRQRRGRLMAAGLAAGLLATTVTVWFFVVSYKRLGNLEQLAARQEAARVQPASSALPVAAKSAASAPVAGSAPGSVGGPATSGTLPGTTLNAAPADGTTIPVSAPGSSEQPEKPTPTTAPVDEPPETVSAALAVTAGTPAMPLPGDGIAAAAVVHAQNTATSSSSVWRALAGTPAGINDRDPATGAPKPRAADSAKPPLPPHTEPPSPQPVSNNSPR